MSGKGYLNNTPDISSGRQANGSQALFRSEAIEAKATSAWLERTPVRTPYLLYVSLFLSVLVLVAFLMILIIGRLDKVVTVHGELVSNPPISYVQAETAGYLLNNKVVRGQKIKAGELMGTLVSESVSINGAKIYETEVAIKKKQMERLKESLVVLGQMLTTAQDNSKNDLGMIEERLENAQENYSSLNKINQSRRKYSVLYKELMAINATTGLEYQSQLERSEAQSQQLRAYKVELKELNTQKTKNNIELKKQRQEVTIKKLEIENELEKLEFDVLQLDKARGENLVSLIDGHVSSIMSNEGVFVASRTPIYGVTPDAAKLVGEIKADVSEAGTVKVGQAVKVKYNAYPYQRYGFFSGIVKSVDLLPSEPNSSGTDKQKFLVMIDVDKDFGTLDEQNVKLKPGLTFDASIVVENRRIYEWFFLPIVKFLHN